MKLFDEIPYLENERIYLKKLDIQDTDVLKELISNDRVYRYLPTFLFEKQYDDMEERSAGCMMNASGTRNP